MHQTGWRDYSPAPNYAKLVKDDASEALDIVSSLRAGMSNLDNERCFHCFLCNDLIELHC